MAEKKARKTAQKTAQKTARKAEPKKAGKTASRSLVGRAGAAARKVVGRGRGSSAEAPTKEPTAKTTAQKKTAQKKTAQKTTAKKTTATKATAKKSAKTASKATAKKAPGRKAAAKSPAKKTAKKATAKQSTAKQSTAKKAPAKQSTAKKGSANKAPAKKGTSRSAAPSQLVVLEQEDPWTKDELAEVRGQLRADIKRLTAELAAAQGELSVLMRDAGEDAGSDQADIGSATFERDQEMTIVNNARDMLAQSERALERIASGTYGVCESCGNPIGKNRLMAFPRATLCMTCKQREERR